MNSKYGGPLVAILLAVASAVVVSACGGGGNASGTTSSTTGGDDEFGGSQGQILAEAGKTVDELYKGKYFELPTSSPKPAVDKNLWVITCALEQVQCKILGAETEAAAEAMEWKTTVVDGQLNPTVEGQYIQKAIAAQADAIVVVAAECESIKNALLEAKRAGIVTFGLYGEQCKDEPLFSTLSTEAGLPNDEAKEKIAAPAKVDWLISQTKGEPKVIDLALTGVETTEASDRGFQARMDECSTCEVVDKVSINATQLSDLGTLTSQALASHPETNAVFMWSGSALPAGVSAAIERSPNAKQMAIMGSSCEGGEIPLMKKGLNVGCLGYEQGEAAYQAVDAINRMFSGVEPSELPQLGYGVQMVDARHNLPKGEEFEAPVDYRAEYKALWGVEK